MLEETKEDMEDPMCEQNENTNKEIENLKEAKNKTWDWKVQYIKFKKSLKGFKGRFKQVEKKNPQT